MKHCSKKSTLKKQLLLSFGLLLAAFGKTHDTWLKACFKQVWQNVVSFWQIYTTWTTVPCKAPIRRIPYIVSKGLKNPALDHNIKDYIWCHVTVNDHYQYIKARTRTVLVSRKLTRGINIPDGKVKGISIMRECRRGRQKGERTSQIQRRQVSWWRWEEGKEWGAREGTEYKREGKKSSKEGATARMEMEQSYFVVLKSLAEPELLQL